jgi:hypothetical protein
MCSGHGPEPASQGVQGRVVTTATPSTPAAATASAVRPPRRDSSSGAARAGHEAHIYGTCQSSAARRY